jgi:putative sterol carrier protein
MQVSSAREFFEGLEGRIDPSKTAGVTASYRFDIDGAGIWRIAVADGAATVTESADAADCTIRMKEDVLLKLIRGEQNPATAFMTGKINVDGDVSLALKLKELFF